MLKKDYNNSITVVYKLSVMMQLVRLGHDVKSVKPNLNRPGFQVFIFNRSEKLWEDLQKITKK